MSDDTPARLKLKILPQPDDVTCGATCLHAVYGYYGDRMELAQVVEEVEQLEEGGTFGALLACHALNRGYRARIYTFNLSVFDPTWFAKGPEALMTGLREQMRHKRHGKLRAACEGYLRFLDLGGELRFEDLTTALIRKHLLRAQPILSGLSATYLYRERRERPADNVPDDVRGQPVGHFVLIHGYSRGDRTVMIADPLDPNPVARGSFYQVGIDRLLCAVLLGVITYDANLVVVWPREKNRQG